MTISTLELVDDRTLAWCKYGDPQGPTLLAVHGSPDSSAAWIAEASHGREPGPWHAPAAV